ncbi:copper resistance protein CopC [Mesorhizobium sp. M0663]|uniref:copper resistance protein CopC n=1 Tax=Mesorhizobium sp. M0663 TaxID=2956981 RepID=UPI00333C8342
MIATVALWSVPLSGQALAHARLVEATPEINSTIAAPPTEIRLRFSESIEARFSGIDLSGPDGAKITTEIAVQDKDMVAPDQGPLRRVFIKLIGTRCQQTGTR